MQVSPISNWIPYKLNYTPAQEWMIKWLDLGKERMILPFFDETIQQCRISQKQRSSLESISMASFLPEACVNLPALEPAAFIFHVSRCGSTLLSQAFTAPEENIVIAEAPLLDEILQADADTSIREHWFKHALHLMGQLRNFKEMHYIIKLDSWHLHFYELLRSWYPATPFFFLYRTPDEVIASHDKWRGIHAVPGMVDHTLLKTEEPEAFGGDFNRYTSQVLEQYYLQLQQIWQLQHSFNSFFDYADGVLEMVHAFSAFTGIPVKDAEQLQQRLSFHSKSAQTVFTPESHTNRERFMYENCQAAYLQFKQLLLSGKAS